MSLSIAPRPLSERHALVLGGGIAGLATAAALSRRFAQVTLVERDLYPDGPGVRPHVPHGAHVHLLLAGGLLTLTRLFPSLPARLDGAGLAEGDLTWHTRVAFEGRWLPRTRSGIPIRTCTRPDVEQILLQLVRECPNVLLRSGCTVGSLLGEARVEGARAEVGGQWEELRADLVVDTMGRSSPALRWVREQGRGEVEETVVDAGVTYSSAWFRPRRPIQDDWALLATLPSIPDDPTMAVLARLGPDRLLCSSMAYGRPPGARSPEELVAATARLRAPQLHALLSSCEPTSEVAVYANTMNRRRRFRRMPEGLVALGDAACSLNPRYGQGMTVAALSVELLDRSLALPEVERDGLVGFSTAFQSALDRAIEVPWQIALMEDRAWVTTIGGGSPDLAQRLALAGSQRLLRAAFSDIDTYIRFMRVAHLLEGPGTMLAPRPLWSVLRGGGRGGEAELPAVD